MTYALISLGVLGVFANAAPTPTPQFPTLPFTTAPGTVSVGAKPGAGAEGGATGGAWAPKLQPGLSGAPSPFQQVNPGQQQSGGLSFLQNPFNSPPPQAGQPSQPFSGSAPFQLSNPVQQANPFSSLGSLAGPTNFGAPTSSGSSWLNSGKAQGSSGTVAWDKDGYTLAGPLGTYHTGADGTHAKSSAGEYSTGPDGTKLSSNLGTLEWGGKSNDNSSKDKKSGGSWFGGWAQ